YATRKPPYSAGSPSPARRSKKPDRSPARRFMELPGRFLEPVMVPVGDATERKPVNTGEGRSWAKSPSCRRLLRRVAVFDQVRGQLPKLDVAGSTPGQQRTRLSPASVPRVSGTSRRILLPERDIEHPSRAFMT